VSVQALADVARLHGCGSSLSALATSWPSFKYACFNGTPTAAAGGAASLPPALGARVSGLTLWGRCSSASPGPLTVANLTPRVRLVDAAGACSGSVVEAHVRAVAALRWQARIELPWQGGAPTQRLECRPGLQQTLQVTCT
jgi:hypothetical protein